MADRYAIDRWPRLCEADEWRESLWVLDLLDRHAPQDLPDGPCLDVGSCAGGYLPGLASFRPGWTLVERDAHRRYLWGATRRAQGEQMAARVGGCRYLATDVREVSGAFALITWLLPYVRPGPLLAADLPMSWFAPEALLEHVLSLLAPGGALIAVNQGPAEAAAQRALLGRHAGWRELGRLTTPIRTWQRERFGFLVRR